MRRNWFVVAKMTRRGPVVTTIKLSCCAKKWTKSGTVREKHLQQAAFNSVLHYYPGILVEVMVMTRRSAAGLPESTWLDEGRP